MYIPYVSICIRNWGKNSHYSHFTVHLGGFCFLNLVFQNFFNVFDLTLIIKGKLLAEEKIFFYLTLQ